MKGESYIATIHTKCKDIVMLVGEGICCSSRFQNKWKYGKNPLSNCFLYVPTTSIKKKHLVLGCNCILMPKSNRCGPKIHEASSASTQYTTKRLFFKLGSWHISQATRGERERERHTHTHTHIDNTMQWHYNSLLKSWKSFNYNCCLQPGDEEQHFSSRYY